MCHKEGAVRKVNALKLKSLCFAAIALDAGAGGARRMIFDTGLTAKVGMPSKTQTWEEWRGVGGGEFLLLSPSQSYLPYSFLKVGSLETPPLSKTSPLGTPGSPAPKPQICFVFCFVLFCFVLIGQG